MQVNAWLNRLTDDQPGRLRSYDLPILKIHDSPQDSQRIDMLLSQPLLRTKADEEWLNKAIRAYPKPADIAANLEAMLQHTRGTLIKIETNQRAQQVHAEIHIAAYVHLFIDAVRPWHLRGDETACILGNIILMQHGVKPILFDDKAAYHHILHRCVQQHDAAPLCSYMHNSIIESQQQQASKLLADLKSRRL